MYRLDLVWGIPKQCNSLILSTSASSYGIPEARAFYSEPRMKGDERFPSMRSAVIVLKLIKYIASLSQPAFLALRTNISTNLSPEFTLKRL